jgi:hypothetical protein
MEDALKVLEENNASIFIPNGSDSGMVIATKDIRIEAGAKR